jgi:hypothetical protein
MVVAVSADDRRAILACEAKRQRRQLRPQGSGMLSCDPTDPVTWRSTDPELLAAIAERRASPAEGDT